MFLLYYIYLILLLAPGRRSQTVAPGAIVRNSDYAAALDTYTLFRSKLEPEVPDGSANRPFVAL